MSKYSLIATDTESHIIIGQDLVEMLVCLGLAKEDEDGDVLVTELRAAAAHCYMVAYDHLDTKDEELDDQLIVEHAEAARIFHNALTRNAIVTALQVESVPVMSRHAHA